MILSESIADQLRRPHGALAPLAAASLNRRNDGLIRRTIRALEVAPDHRVLDVGFGGGLSLRLLSVTAGAGRVVGIDPSSEMVVRAQRVLGRQISRGRVEVQRAAVEDLPFEHASFDRVLTCQTVYFWDDLPKGLAEIYRVLVRGGRLSLAMMPKTLQERFGFADRGCRVLSHDELMRRMEGSGFVDVQPWPSGASDPHWIIVASKP